MMRPSSLGIAAAAILVALALGVSSASARIAAAGRAVVHPASPSRHAAFVPSIALPSIATVLHQPRRYRIPEVPGHRPNSSGKWLYTAQLYGDDLGVYQQGDLYLNYFETLKNGVSAPQGTVATRSGWWYVANGGDSDVLVYITKNGGPEGPVAVLQDAGQIPADVDATSSRRLVAVSNVSTVSLGSGSVSVYLDRGVVPSRTLAYGTDLVQGIGVALDHQGNCYWSFNDETTKSGSIVEFKNCLGSGTPLVTGLGAAGGLTFDQAGNLYYSDQTVGLYKCKHSAECGLFSTGFGDPVNINFDLKGKELWVADATGYIDAVDPTSGRIVYQTQAVGGSSDPPFGVAAAPGIK